MRKNKEKILQELINDETYYDYLERLKRICVSMFEWQNLPKSMDQRFLEDTLFTYGEACFLNDKDYGFINLRCTGEQYNIYKKPINLRCFSINKFETKKVYSGLIPEGINKDDFAIHIYNNWERIPTLRTISIFAKRLAEAERTCDINVKAQKTPILLVCDENQRNTMELLYDQYNGNKPVIMGDKNQLSENTIRAINTNAPYVVDKLQTYKKQIWNECLEYLGINSMQTEKKERLITDEASSNNELINLNLQSFLIPRQRACDEFNELFGLKGTDKEISVRLRSDLWNIIKEENSVVKEFVDENNNGIDDREEGVVNE